ncbi:copper resistance protein CopC [Pseudarthrobacter sp. Fe7]|nr:copper resistance protein CopC [Pseudarthrobacter sp. Fe7]
MKTVHSTGLRGWLGRCLLILALAAFPILLAPPAQAHDVLESSDPADGSTVPAVPAQIGLTFDHTPWESDRWCTSRTPMERTRPMVPSALLTTTSPRQ